MFTTKVGGEFKWSSWRSSLLPDRATTLLNLPARMKFLVTPGKQATVIVEHCLLFASGFSFCCLSLCVRASGTWVRGPTYWLRFTVFKKASNLNLKTPYNTKKRSTIPPGASLLPSTCSPTQHRCTAQPVRRSLSS